MVPEERLVLVGSGGADKLPSAGRAPQDFRREGVAPWNTWLSELLYVAEAVHATRIGIPVALAF